MRKRKIILRFDDSKLFPDVVVKGTGNMWHEILWSPSNSLSCIRLSFKRSHIENRKWVYYFDPLRLVKEYHYE